MKSKKKWGILALATTLSLSLLVSCGSSDSGTTSTPSSATSTPSTATSTPSTTTTTTPDTTTPEVTTYSTEFVLEYPPFVEGYDPIVLDSVPENVVCLSTAPVLALHEMGANIVVVPTTTVLTYPDDLKEQAEVVVSVTSEDFDIENIIAKDPDLVFIPSSAYDKYGEILEMADIPCYVVSTSMLVSDHYEIIKGETKVFTDAFVKDDVSAAKAEEILARFDDLDTKIEAAKELLEGKTYLSAMVNPNGFFVQQDTSTLPGILNKFGMVNVYSPVMGETTAPIDLETVVDLQNDLQIFITATMDAEFSKENALTNIANQQEVWDSVKAIQDGNVLYLTTNYWGFGGLQVIDSVESLIDLLYELFDV